VAKPLEDPLSPASPILAREGINKPILVAEIGANTPYSQGNLRSLNRREGFKTVETLRVRPEGARPELCRMRTLTMLCGAAPPEIHPKPG
jgi:hypothetical protein